MSVLFLEGNGRNAIYITEIKHPTNSNAGRFLYVAIKLNSHCFYASDSEQNLHRFDVDLWRMTSPSKQPTSKSIHKY